MSDVDMTITRYRQDDDNWLALTVTGALVADNCRSMTVTGDFENLQLKTGF